MFSRLTIVRIKAAENALRDGRYDEAYRLATAPDLRDHRRAQKVLVRAARKLIERARSHYDAGLYDEALADLDRAAAANVELAEINRLRGEIREAARQSRYHEQQQQRRLGAARNRIEAGSLIGGQRILEQADTRDRQVEQLRRMASANAAQAKAELDESEKLLKRNQFPAALERLQRARALNAHDPRAMEVEGRIVKRLLDEASEALQKGRTDRARATLHMMGRTGRNDPRRHELERNLDLIARVARTAGGGQYEEALRLLRQLRHLLPEVRWIKEAQEHVQQLSDTRMTLLSGPLGMSFESAMGGPGTGGASPGRGVPVRDIDQPTRAAAPAARGKVPVWDESVAGGMVPEAGGGLPPRLLMLIDGVGSFLILTQPRVSIGRMAGGPGGGQAVADIALMADISKHHADIARLEDDYVIFPHRQVLIDGEPSGHRLLFDKNRITLGRLAQITYRLPNPRSSTAVLILSDGVRMNRGVRTVLLFSELAVLGSGPGCHVRLPGKAGNLILYSRKGKLFMRPQPQRPEERFDPRLKQEIRLGEPFTLQDIGFCFEVWPDEGGPAGASA